MKILAGSNSKALAKNIALLLKAEYIESITTHFKDSETQVQILDSLQGFELVIVQSTSRPVNDNLVELLLLIDAAKRGGAQKIIAVIPYFGYSRQDCASHNLGPGVPALVANLLETAGANFIITLDLHSSKIENFFKIPVYNLSPLPLFMDSIQIYDRPLVIVAPDKGSLHRIENTKINHLNVVFLTKKRNTYSCEMLSISGEVQGKHCMIIDDIIDSGETLCKSTDFLIKAGAASVNVFVTHAVLSSLAKEHIQASLLENIYITDTIEHTILPSKFRIVPTAPLIARILSLLTVRS